MADVKWIKITTDMFDNRKIKYLRKLPEGNNIVLIWVMLLTMAGRCNSGGMIFLTENIPYTTKLLADELNFEEATVQLALKALAQLEMIVTDGDYFMVAGWQEHQNIEGMDKIREQNRLRKRKQREREKLVLDNGHVMSRDGHETDIERDKDKEENNIISSGEDNPPPPPPSKPKKKEAIKHKYGEHKNVLLTDDEVEKLKVRFGSSYLDKIDRLSTGIALKGYKYKSHYLAILSWFKDEEPPHPMDDLIMQGMNVVPVFGGGNE